MIFVLSELQKMYCRNNFVVRSIALLAIGIFLAGTDARAPQKLLSSTEARLGEIKYHVGLKRGLYNVCGGALISESHVLTAAHCFNGVNPPYTDGLVIVTGTTNIKSNDGEHHYAKRVTIYPDYVKGNSTNRWRHDIAVITLRTPAVKNEVQAPISLPTSDITTSVVALLSGWGQMQKGWDGKYPEILQKTPVTILTQADCNSRNSILDTQICGFDGKDTGFCNGDSGGPLVYNGEVVGVVSFGVSCGIGYPDVYTRVWSYKNFITEAMKLQ